MDLIVDRLNTLHYVICERLIKLFFCDAFISLFQFSFISLTWLFIFYQISTSSPPNPRQLYMKTIEEVEEKSKKKSCRKLTISSTKLMISLTGVISSRKMYEQLFCYFMVFLHKIVLLWFKLNFLVKIP